MTDYHQYMRSKEWERTREKALLRAKGACEVCGEWRSTLEVHHTTYDRLGHEDPNDLMVLCIPCHNVADVLRWAGQKYGESARDMDFDLLQIEYQGRPRRENR